MTAASMSPVITISPPPNQPNTTPTGGSGESAMPTGSLLENNFFVPAALQSGNNPPPQLPAQGAARVFSVHFSHQVITVVADAADSENSPRNITPFPPAPPAPSYSPNRFLKIKLVPSRREIAHPI